MQDLQDRKIHCHSFVVKLIRVIIHQAAPIIIGMALQKNISGSILFPIQSVFLLAQQIPLIEKLPKKNGHKESET